MESYEILWKQTLPEIAKTVSAGENALPITFDDVLDAHHYIQNLDENWKNFIQNTKMDT